MGGARGFSRKLSFHYQGDSTPSTRVRTCFSSTETRTGTRTSRPNPLSTQEPSARSRAYARVARELEQWVVSTDTQAKSRWDPPPPNHKISLRRARDEPPRARARVVAKPIGQRHGVCTSSFCTCDGFFSSDGKGRADARARFSEFAFPGLHAWRVRERRAPRPVWSWCVIPQLRRSFVSPGLGRRCASGHGSRHWGGADRRRLRLPSRP